MPGVRPFVASDDCIISCVRRLDGGASTCGTIGEAIAEDTSSQFLAQDSYSADFAAQSADATLEDLEELVNSFEQTDVASTEDEQPQTAMGLATATPEPDSAGTFFILEEGSCIYFAKT